MVAFLDRSEDAHAWARTALTEVKGNFITTSAVITEAMHFIAPIPSGPEALSAFVDRGPVQIFDFCQPVELRRAVARMGRYADAPMDFADATLVLLAEATGTGDILTLDRRGFTFYRWGKNRAFNLLASGSARLTSRGPA